MHGISFTHSRGEQIPVKKGSGGVLRHAAMGHVNNQEKNSCGQYKKNTPPSDILKERFNNSTGDRGREITFKRGDNAQRQNRNEMHIE